MKFGLLNHDQPYSPLVVAIIVMVIVMAKRGHGRAITPLAAGDSFSKRLNLNINIFPARAKRAECRRKIHPATARTEAVMQIGTTISRHLWLENIN